MYVPPREASACSSGNKVSHSLVTQEDNAAFVIKDGDDSLVIKEGDDSLAPNKLKRQACSSRGQLSSTSSPLPPELRLDYNCDSARCVLSSLRRSLILVRRVQRRETSPASCRLPSQHVGAAVGHCQHRAGNSHYFVRLSVELCPWRCFSNG